MSLDRRESTTSVHFPEVSGGSYELTNILEDVQLRRIAADALSPIEFTARLPWIIGYVPSAERAIFSNFVTKNGFPLTGHGILPEDTLLEEDHTFQEVIHTLPGTYSIIANDMIRLRENGIADIMLDSFFMERKETTAGQTPRDPEFHIDPKITYLISDINATEYYQGKAKLNTYPGRKGVIFDETSVDTKAPVLAAPNFSIVRMSPLTVHRSPVFRKHTQRSFMAFFTKFN